MTNDFHLHYNASNYVTVRSVAAAIRRKEGGLSLEYFQGCGIDRDHGFGLETKNCGLCLSVLISNSVILFFVCRRFLSFSAWWIQNLLAKGCADLLTFYTASLFPTHYRDVVCPSVRMSSVTPLNGDAI